MSHLRRQDWALLIILTAASLLSIRLGFWQLDRLEQRLQRNQGIESKLEEKPQTFSLDLAEYTPVTLSGTYISEYEIVIENRTKDDVAGFHLMTPIETMDGLWVMVDRGWIPYERGANLSLALYLTESPVTVEGVLLAGQTQPNWAFLADPVPGPGDPPLRTWRLIDLTNLQQQLPAPLHSQYIALTSIETSSSTQPSPNLELDLSNGPHLSYAIQWFSFAAIAIIGGIVMLRRNLHRNRDRTA